MARTPKLQKLTISLLKDGISREGVFRDTASPSGYRIAALDSSADSLFIDAKRASTA